MYDLFNRLSLTGRPIFNLSLGMEDYYTPTYLETLTATIQSCQEEQLTQ